MTIAFVSGDGFWQNRAKVKEVSEKYQDTTGLRAENAVAGILRHVR